MFSNGLPSSEPMTQVSMLQEELLEEEKTDDKKSEIPHSFRPLINIIFKDLATAKTALKLIETQSPIPLSKKILDRMLTRHWQGKPMIWGESPYLMTIVVDILEKEKYISPAQSIKLTKYIELCKKKIESIKEDIVTKIILNHDTDLELILRLVEDGDPDAIQIIQEKLDYHRNQIRQSLAKPKPSKKIDCSADYLIPPHYRNEFLSDELIHLQQIIFLYQLGPEYSTCLMISKTLVELYEEEDLEVDNKFFFQLIVAALNIVRQLTLKNNISDSLFDRIYQALKLDDAQAILLMLKNTEISHDTTLGKDKTPIIVEAARYGCEKIIKILHVYGANISATSTTTENVLTAVCDTQAFLPLHEQRLAIAKFFVEVCDFKIETPGSHKQTAVHKATLSQFDLMLDYLFLKNAQPNPIDEFSQTPVMLLSQQKFNYPIFDILLRNGADYAFLNKNPTIFTGYIAYLLELAKPDFNINFCTINIIFSYMCHNEPTTKLSIQIPPRNKMITGDDKIILIEEEKSMQTIKPTFVKSKSDDTLIPTKAIAVEEEAIQIVKPKLVRSKSDDALASRRKLSLFKTPKTNQTPLSLQSGSTPTIYTLHK